MKDYAGLFVLFLCCAQLVLRSSILISKYGGCHVEECQDL